MEEKVDDETIQSIVYQKAKRLGYGLRILPKVKSDFSNESIKFSLFNSKVTEFLLGSASQNKVSSSSNKVKGSDFC